MKGWLRSLFWIVGGAIALLVFAVLILSLVRIPIDVSDYKGVLEAAVSDALGRKVVIDGDVALTTSLWPYFQVQEIRVENPQGFEAGNLAKMDRVRIRVGLVALVDRRIRIRSLHVDGLAIDLLRNQHGAVNWAFAAATESTAAPTETPDSEEPALSPWARGLSVDDIELEAITATYREAGDPRVSSFVMKRALGAAAHGEPMNLDIRGILLGEPFTLHIEANSLGEFLAFTHTRLEMELDIAETQLHFSGTSDALGGRRTSEMDVKIEGKRLDSLDALLGIDLPPLKDYRLGGRLALSTGHAELSNLDITVKKTTLNGSMVVDRTGSRPFATLDLKARRIQLTDLDTGDWSPDDVGAGEPPAAASTEEGAGSEQVSVRKVAALLSPETLQRADLKLVLDVDEVLSRDDVLGSGELKLELDDGRIAIDPLRLKLSDSRLLLKASFEPGTGGSEATLRVLIEDFDFGALLRLKDPETDIGGTLSMDVDLTAAAGDVRSLLTGANGYLDVAGVPENFRSGIIDLWAVNLLSSVVSAAGDEDGASMVNCIISRWELQDGMMAARSLAVDTSRIRICGEGNIDFDTESIDLVVSPVAKHPEFFSLATPLAVTGDFDDFRIGVKGGFLNVGRTAVKFALSPVATPIKRLLREDLPKDGRDICALPIGPHEGELAALPGC